MAGAEAKAELVSSRYVLVRGARRRAANWSCTAERVRAIERPGARMGHLSGWRGGTLAGAPGGPAGEEKTPPRDAVGRVRHGDGARGCCWCWCRVFVDVRSWAHGRYFGYQATKLWTPNIRTENAILDRKNNLGRTRLESQRRSEFSADFKSVEKRVRPLHFVGVNTRNDRPLIYE